MDERLEALRRLLETLDRLHGPDGCPWDRSQTVESMAPHVLEEAYEVVDAIAAGRSEKTAEEVGDLAMVLLALCRVAETAGRFTAADAAKRVTEKLVRRHPHVFGTAKVTGVEQVLHNWETIKRSEKGGDGSALAGIPRSLPALLRAYRTVEKAARLGFDWNDLEEVAAKVEEEWGEFREAAAAGDPSRVEGELGDLLLAIAGCARRAGVNPEIALRCATDRFVERTRTVEARLGGRLSGVGRETLLEAWNEAKRAVP